MEKLKYVVLHGQRLDHNKERLAAGASVLMTDEEAEPLLVRGVIALPEDAEKKDVLSISVNVADTQGFKDLTATNASLLEQIDALKADIETREEAMALLEGARLDAEAAAKAAAEAQVAAEAEVSKLQAEVSKLQAELKAATAKAPAKTESKPK